jgi:proteasome lid subunit RPN8/RPN11
MFQVEEVQTPAPPLTTLTDLGVGENQEPMSGEVARDAGDPDDAAEWNEEGDAVGSAEVTGEEADDDAGAPVGVVLSSAAYERLAKMPLSKEVEEGGFLIGHVFGNKDESGQFLVSITAVIKAERTGASLLHFTFTGESFMRVSEVITRRGRDEELVGWYHTHLFPATDQVGLSSIDVDLHAATFKKPWQLAGLINVTRGSRVIRFYGTDHDGIAEMPFWLSKS